MKIEFLRAGQQFYSLSLLKNNIFGQIHFESILTQVVTSKKLLNYKKMVSQGIKSIAQKGIKKTQIKSMETTIIPNKRLQPLKILVLF